MIPDNENENLKVHEWISKYTEEGKLDIVNIDIEENRPLDLLNENITIEAALRLKSVSQECVRFLKQDKVSAKTLEPNFCHAKSYLFNPTESDDRKKYFISGSSNLTEAGIGLKQTNNVELNILT